MSVNNKSNTFSVTFMYSDLLNLFENQFAVLKITIFSLKTIVMTV